MTNKQIKILNNKVNQVTEEIEKLNEVCTTRLTLLAKNDPIYQNFQGQLGEKEKHIKTIREFIQTIIGEDQNVRTPTQDSGPPKPQGRKRTTTKPTSNKEKES